MRVVDRNFPSQLLFLSIVTYLERILSNELSNPFQQSHHIHATVCI